jgi:hypothetical protein
MGRGSASRARAPRSHAPSSVFCRAARRRLGRSRHPRLQGVLRKRRQLTRRPAVIRSRQPIRPESVRSSIQDTLNRRPRPTLNLDTPAQRLATVSTTPPSPCCTNHLTMRPAPPARVHARPGLWGVVGGGVAGSYGWWRRFLLCGNAFGDGGVGGSWCVAMLLGRGVVGIGSRGRGVVGRGCRSGGGCRGLGAESRRKSTRPCPHLRLFEINYMPVPRRGPTCSPRRPRPEHTALPQRHRSA